MLQDKHQTNLEDTKVPFQAQLLQEFVGQVGRLFYDDACIVLLDFLAREQRAFQESDLRDILGWRESLIQQKLYLLNKQLLVTQAVGGSSAGGRRSVFWRISHHIHSAVHLRYQQLIDRLAKLVEDATQQHEFECSNTSCGLKHTALDVASCSRAIEDEHPLCLQCSSLLKASGFEETLQLAKDKRSRALQQLETLRQNLLRIQNMEIPFFPPYTKQDKEMAAVNVEFLAETNQIDTEEKKSEPLCDPHCKHSQSVHETLQNSLKEAEYNKAHEISETSLNSSLISLTSMVSQDRSHHKRSQPSVSHIPWFDNTSESAQKGSFSAHRDLSSDRTPQVQSSEQRTLSLKQSSTNHTNSSSTENPHATSFGIKKIKLTPEYAGECKTQNLDFSIPSHPADDFFFPEATQQTASSISITASPNLTSTATAYDFSSSATENPCSESWPEVEIQISRLNRRVKLSEITEDIEQYMTDEEYKIYYNATPDLALCGLTE